MRLVDYERRDGKVLLGGLEIVGIIETEGHMGYGLGRMEAIISISFMVFKHFECCLRDCEVALGYGEEFCRKGIDLYKEAKGKVPEIGSKLSLELYGLAYREVYKSNEEESKEQIFKISREYCEKINHYKNINECSLKDLRTLYETYNSDILECIEKMTNRNRGMQYDIGIFVLKQEDLSEEGKIEKLQTILEIDEDAAKEVLWESDYLYNDALWEKIKADPDAEK